MNDGACQTNRPRRGTIDAIKETQLCRENG